MTRLISSLPRTWSRKAATATGVPPSSRGKSSAASNERGEPRSRRSPANCATALACVARSCFARASTARLCVTNWSSTLMG